MNLIQIKNLLYDYLAQEPVYSFLEIREMIETANITFTDEKITIVYSNGVTEELQIATQLYLKKVK